MFLPFSTCGKAWEPKALALRAMLRLSVNERLDPWQLAPVVGLTVAERTKVLEILKTPQGEYLLGEGANCWSGGVLPERLPDGTFVCILNPTHSERRNRITLMEEITHTYLNHRPSEIITNTDSTDIRDYDDKQEAEAYGIGAAALMPWKPFFSAINTGRTVDELSAHYDVTPDLIKYRIKTTGAYKLYTARQRVK